jgi:predicted Fe-Mo cluster-binding NifX family protein
MVSPNNSGMTNRMFKHFEKYYSFSISNVDNDMKINHDPQRKHQAPN